MVPTIDFGARKKAIYVEIEHYTNKNRMETNRKRCYMGKNILNSYKKKNYLKTEFITEKVSFFLLPARSIAAF